MNAALQVHRPASVAQAVRVLRDQPQARLIGGGTEIVALTRSGLMPSGPLVTLRSMGLDGITLRDGWLSIGAGATMAAVARSPQVLQEAPALAQALLAGASPQVRNAATLGGNLMQRTRCPYYRGRAAACNRIEPGSGCAVLAGEQREAAIFGGSDVCRATHASDLAVVLLSLDAQLVVMGPEGERRLAIEALHAEPTTTQAAESTLVAGELITAIELPLSAAARSSVYVKLRDRASFQFALVSVAAALHVEQGRVIAARLAAGGVATRPWRLNASEAALYGASATDTTWTLAAGAATEGAQPLPGNTFKLELLQRCVMHTLQRCGGAR